MRFRNPILSLSLALLGLVFVGTTACSSGGGATPGPAAVAAPRSLAYATNPAVYTLGQPIAANAPSHAGGAVAGYAVAPGLPAGLALDPVSGILTGTPTALATAATYTVTASNGGGSATAALSLTVNPAPAAPVFTAQPASISISAGQAAHFAVSATGTPAPTLRWQTSVNGTTWADLGATGNTYDALAVTLADDGRLFRVVASNAAGTVNSNVATLTVTAAAVAPVFTLQPVDLTLTEGQNGQFVVAVTGTPTPTLDWQVSVNNGAWFSFGVTTPVYDVWGPMVDSSGRRYRAVASNAAGTVASNPATLTVLAAVTVPAFTTQPANQSVTAPNPATFTAAVTGTPAPTLQWQRSNDSGVTWTDLVGATNATFSTGATASTDNNAQFRVMASNTAGSLASAAATLTVASQPKTWQAAGLVSADVSGSVMEPHLGFDALGNAIAIWIHNDAGVNRYDLWANRYVAGTGWGTPQVIFPGVDTRVNRPQLGVAADGTALVLWELMDDPYNPLPHILSIRFDPATGWGTANRIDNDSGTTTSDSPKLAVAANGAAVAVWDQGDGLTVIRVCMLTGSSSTGWVGSPAVLASGPLAQPGQVGAPDVILNAQGDGFAFWQYYDGTNFQLTAAPLAAGAIGTSQVIATAGSFYNPHAAINAAGTAVMIWGQYNGSRLEIDASRSVPGSGWGSPVQVNSSGWTTFTQTPDPQIVLDDAGTATALWVEGTGASSPKVWNHQTAAGWGLPEIISYTLGEYRLAGNGAGQLLGARFSGQAVYGSPAYLASVGDWGAGSLLTSTGFIPLELKMDVSGNGLAVWIQPVTGGYALWGSLYR